jgi:cytochrome c
MKDRVFVWLALLILEINIPSEHGVGLPYFHQEVNHPPVVKIISPNNNSHFAAGTRVYYSIHVSDKEDGDSRFNEINPREVLLQVRYSSDSIKLNLAHLPIAEIDPPGLTAMRVSNCFNCHAFGNKMIGPSINDIVKKYEPSATNKALLAKRVQDGSIGIWGNVSMPKHPELTKEEIHNMVEWMMQLIDHPDINYYVGTESFFDLPPASISRQNHVGLLIASYVDHGLHNSGPHLRGQDAILIEIK